MAGKWSVKNPLTIEERKIIKRGLKENLTYLDISYILGRAKSTVIRECKRLGNLDKYTAEKAQEHFEETQKNKNLSISKTLRARYEKIKKGKSHDQNT